MSDERRIPMTRLLAKRTIYVRLSDEHHDQIDRVAAETGCEPEQVVEAVLIEYLSKRTEEA